MSKTKMRRFQIYMGKPQYGSIKLLAEHVGIPIAEYIRRVLDAHIAEETKKAFKQIKK